MKIKDIQDEGVEILIDITTILEKNNIKYFLDFGTQIGASRNNGVIPWDYDFDIGCSIKDYYKIKEVLKNNEKYDISFNHENNNKKTSASIVIYSKNKRLYFSGENKGIYLDIFIYEKSVKVNSFTKGLLKLKYFKFATKKKIYNYGYKNTLKVWKLENISLIKRVIFSLLYLVISLIYPIINAIINMLKSDKQYNFSLDANLFSLNELSVTYDRRHYDLDLQKTAVIDGHKFYEFKDIEYFLSKTYGSNWRMPPNEDQIRKQILEQFPKVVKV